MIAEKLKIWMQIWHRVGRGRELYRLAFRQDIVAGGLLHRVELYSSEKTHPDAIEIPLENGKTCWVILESPLSIVCLGESFRDSGEMHYLALGQLKKISLKDVLSSKIPVGSGKNAFTFFLAQTRA